MVTKAAQRRWGRLLLVAAVLAGHFDAGSAASLGVSDRGASHEVSAAAASQPVTCSAHPTLRPTSLTVGGGTVLNYVLDKDGLVTSVGAETVQRSATSGRITGNTVGTTTVTYGYDPTFGDVNAITNIVGGQSVLTRAFHRDNRARIDQATETTPAGTFVNDYGFDAADRLVSVKANGQVAYTYTYDVAGNRTSATAAPSPTVTATVDPATNRLMAYGDRTFSYNLQGQLQTVNRTGLAPTTYAYFKNNLNHIGLSDGRSIDYVLDSAGRRVAKKVNGSIVEGYVWDGSALVAVTNAAGAVQAQFVYVTDQVSPDYMIKQGVTYRLAKDERGSIRSVVNASTGAVAQALTYDPYGIVLSDSSPGFQPLGYTGALWDRDSQLLHLGAREYDPTTGRFTTADPAGYSGGPNVYAYTDGDPINRIDPSGHDWLGCLQDISRIVAMFAPGIAPVILGINAAIDIARGDYAAAVFDAGGALLPMLGSSGSKARLGEGLDDAAAAAGEGVAPLRQAYFDDFAKLSDEVSAWRGAGAEEEFIAGEAWANRRALGMQYKDLTSPEELARITARNVSKYGDPLGPTIDFLRSVDGKSWTEIIESSLRHNGKDLGPGY